MPPLVFGAQKKPGLDRVNFSSVILFQKERKKEPNPKPSTRKIERERRTGRQTERERLESELGGGVVRTWLTYLSNCALGSRVGHAGLTYSMGCLFRCLQTVKYVLETFSELC